MDVDRRTHHDGEGLGGDKYAHIGDEVGLLACRAVPETKEEAHEGAQAF